MKDKTTATKAKKPIYKKWWFWAIIVVILTTAFASQGVKDGFEDGVKDTISSTEQQTTTSASGKFIEDVKAAIQGAINSKEESITDVVLKDGDLYISVDLSKANPLPLTTEDLAISRTGSITDAILELTDYDIQWKTITIDFGDIGKVTNSKDNVKENELGGRYFPSENFILK